MSSCATNSDCSSGNVCVNRTCQPPSQGFPFYVWVAIGISAGIFIGAIALVVFCRRKRNRQKIKTGRKSERLNPPLYNRGEGDGPAPLPQGYKKPIDLFQVAQLNRNEEAKRLSRLSAAYYTLSQVGSDGGSVHSNQSQYGDYPQAIQMRPFNSNRNSFIPFSHESGPRPAGTSGENYGYSYAYPTMVYNTQTTEMGMRGVPGTSGSRLSMMHMGMTPVPLPNFENSNYNSKGNGSTGRGVELRHSKSAYSHPYQGVYDGSQAVADARGMNIIQDGVSVKRTQSESETASFSFIPQNRFILPEHQMSDFRDFNDPVSGNAISEENLQTNCGFSYQGQLKDEPSKNSNEQMTMVDRRKTLTLDMRYFEPFGNTNATPTTPSKTTPLINLGNSGRNHINEDNTAMQEMAKMERNESFEMGNQNSGAMMNESLGPLSPSMVTPVFNPSNLKVRQ